MGPQDCRKKEEIAYWVPSVRVGFNPHGLRGRRERALLLAEAVWHIMEVAAETPDIAQDVLCSVTTPRESLTFVVRYSPEMFTTVEVTPLSKLPVWIDPVSSGGAESTIGGRLEARLADLVGSAWESCAFEERWGPRPDGSMLKQYVGPEFAILNMIASSTDRKGSLMVLGREMDQRVAQYAKSTMPVMCGNHRGFIAYLNTERNMPALWEPSELLPFVITSCEQNGDKAGSRWGLMALGGTALRWRVKWIEEPLEVEIWGGTGARPPHPGGGPI